MTGKIIRFIDDHTAIINLGSVDGVEPRMRFGIYTPTDEIVDPETNEVLGTYRRRKGIVVVDEVHERFCVASAPSVREEVVEETTGAILGARTRRRTTTRRDLDVARGQVKPLPTGDEVLVGDTVEVLTR